MGKKRKIKSVDADIIQLKPHEHVRKRPGMYVGGTDAKAMQHLIDEVVDNAVDEALAGRCRHITITLLDNNVVSISDDGPGISPIVNQFGHSKLEMVFTTIGMC